MHNCITIVLAAGCSTRIGTENKLLIDVCWVPMVERVVTAALQVSDGPVTVVLGHQGDRVCRVLAPLKVQFIYNPDYQAGQMTSVLAGLSTAPKAQSYLISPGDMPDLTAPSLAALLVAHCASDQQKITLPMQTDRRGNPIVIPHGCVKDILADPQNLGCHGFTRKNPDRTHLFKTTDPTFFRDIDTPGYLAQFMKNNSLSSLGLSF